MTSTSLTTFALAVQRKRRAMMLSIGTALTLTIVKMVIAAITGSVAVLSEAVHSMTDLIAAGLIFYAVSHASSPPDSRHRYGHEKLEDVSAVAEGTIVVAAIGFVVYQAVNHLRVGTEVEAPLLAVVVMVIGALVNLAVAMHLRKVGRETESPGVAADGAQLLVDVYTSAGVAVGLALVHFTGKDWIDPLVALIVSAMVVRVGFSLILGSTRVLLDEALPPGEIAAVEGVLANFKDVAGYHRLRTRKAGSRRHVDLHVTLDGDLPLREAHEIAHDIELAIAAVLRNADVLTHIEPDTEAPEPGQDVGPSDTRWDR